MIKANRTISCHDIFHYACDDKNSVLTSFKNTVDKGEQMRDPGIHSRRIRVGTPITPAGHTHKMPSTIDSFTHHWSSTVTLEQ